MEGLIKYTLNTTSCYTQNIYTLNDFSDYINETHGVSLENSMITYVDFEGDEICILDDRQFEIALVQFPELLKLRI